VAENVMCEQKYFLVHWSHMCGINEPLPWGLRNTSENPVVFRCNTAYSSKKRFQHTVRFLVATQFIQCNDLQRKKRIDAGYDVTTEIRIRLSPWVGCHKLQPFLSL